MFPTSLVGQTHRGSFLCKEWELRVTERCLRDDLGVDAAAEFASFEDLEIIIAFKDKRSDRVEDTREVAPLTCGRTVWVLARGNDHRGGTWYDEHERVVWLLAYGLHRSGEPDDFFPYCKSIDAAGELLPTESDYQRLAEDRDHRFAWSITIQIPMLLREARETGQEVRALLGGECGAAVAVEVDPEVEAISVAFDSTTLPFDHVPLILATLHGDQDWEQAGEMPSRPLDPGEIAFRHHHEPPSVT